MFQEAFNRSRSKRISLASLEGGYYPVGTLHDMKACGTSIIDWTSSTVPQQFFTNAENINADGHICRAVKPVVPRQKLVSLSLICGAAVKARLLKTES